MKPRDLSKKALVCCGAVVLAGTVFAQAERPETVRVCTHPAPGFFTRAADGRAEGLEFDLLAGFAAATKRDLVYVAAPSFDQLLRDTEAGACHIGAATVTASPERRAKLLFSTPYFPNRIVVVQKTSTEFAAESDLKDRRVAVVKGTISERLVKAIPAVRPVLVRDDAVAFEALLKGEADALACDSAVVLHHLGLHRELAMAFPIGERSYFAFALPLGSQLVRELDKYLEDQIRTGQFAKVLAKHFGADNAEILAADIAEVTVK